MAQALMAFPSRFGMFDSSNALDESNLGVHCHVQYSYVRQMIKCRGGNGYDGYQSVVRVDRSDHILMEGEPNYDRGHFARLSRGE